jgi:hypothetical protein
MVGAAASSGATRPRARRPVSRAAKAVLPGAALPAALTGAALAVGAGAERGPEPNVTVQAPGQVLR